MVVADAFQTVRRARSFGLRDSGGGCSFGAATPPEGYRELSRAAFRQASPPETRRALASRAREVNAESRELEAL